MKPYEYNINVERPQVLLVGNGISRCCGGPSWDDILDEIRDINTKSTADFPDVPFPLKFNALIRLENENDKRKQLCEKILNADTKETSLIDRLLILPNNQILTTNYSYELEESIVPGFSKIKYRRDKYIRETEKDYRYLLHTFNQMNHQLLEKNIWHIHGEARRQSSLILNHDSYARLTHKIIEQSHKVENHFQKHKDKNEPIYFDSWFDYFLLGDIYMIGQGYDFSEFTLWWLLNRKARETANEGKVYFYELSNAEPKELSKPKDKKDDLFKFCSEYTRQQEKYSLLQSFGVEICQLGMKKHIIDGHEKYLEFYQKALKDIEAKMRNAKS